MSGRWQTIPDAPMALRSELVAWMKGDGAILKGWCLRQGPTVVDWVRVRGQMYEQVYTQEKPARLWHEAALDLLCWQRGGVSPRKALQWLRDFEATIQDGRRSDG